jgi:hypothetical protein
MRLCQISDAVEALAESGHDAPSILLQLYLAYIQDYTKTGLSFRETAGEQSKVIWLDNPTGLITALDGSYHLKTTLDSINRSEAEGSDPDENSSHEYNSVGEGSTINSSSSDKEDT